MTARTPMTQEGYNKIKADIERMENEEMPIIAQKIADARAEGDLKENAEYHGQREAQGMLQAKINQLKSKLASATIIDMAKVNRSEVAFGATVTILDIDIDDEEEITLVGGVMVLVAEWISAGLLCAKKAPKLGITTQWYLYSSSSI